MNPYKKITIIIPFLNEGVEVEETVKNIKEHAKIPFDIILINDGSTDKYNYFQVAQKYNCIYREHKNRVGVASSRDEGVLLARTKYILLLDAHMRVYQDDWLENIITHLEELSDNLLCAATIPLDLDGNKTSEKIGYGAYWDFNTSNIHWVTKITSEEKKSRRVEVPCLLGASYAFDRDYWLKLKGLEGLSSYGLDEQFICLKNWIMGGKSYVALDVKFGHKFRDNTTVPYELNSPDFIRNILLVAEMFYSTSFQANLLSFLKEQNGLDFLMYQIASLEIYQERIVSTKLFFKENATRSFSELVSYNDYFIQSRNEECT